MSKGIGIVCPGQGSQRVGMLDALPAHESVDRLLDAAEALTSLPLRRIAASGPDEALADTRAAQPLLYLADWTWGATLMSAGIEPAAVAGHSLGELAALALADVFSVEAGLELVVERSKLMAATAAVTPGAMIAVLGLDRDAIEAAVDTVDEAWAANDNAPGQIVVSGTQQGLDDAEKALSDAGARRVVRLAVAGPFHSPLMEPARAAFSDLLERTEFRDATIPVLQNVDPSPAREADTIKSRLIHQITSPVRWTDTMSSLQSMGVTIAVECGPGAVLKGLARRIDGLTVHAVEADGLEAIVEEVGR